MRVVYDASSKVFGPSLNDYLHIGPFLNPLLFNILLRFRVNEVASTADIMEVCFACVVFGVNSSPFILNATIRHHLNTFAS